MFGEDQSPVADWLRDNDDPNGEIDQFGQTWFENPPNNSNLIFPGDFVNPPPRDIVNANRPGLPNQNQRRDEGGGEWGGSPQRSGNGRPLNYFDEDLLLGNLLDSPTPPSIPRTPTPPRDESKRTEKKKGTRKPRQQNEEKKERAPRARQERKEGDPPRRRGRPRKDPTQPRPPKPAKDPNQPKPPRKPRAPRVPRREESLPEEKKAERVEVERRVRAERKVREDRPGRESVQVGHRERRGRQQRHRGRQKDINVDFNDPLIVQRTPHVLAKMSEWELKNQKADGVHEPLEDPDGPLTRLTSNTVDVHGITRTFNRKGYLNRHLILPEEINDNYYYRVDSAAKISAMQGELVSIIGIKWIQASSKLTFQCKSVASGKIFYTTYIDGTSRILIDDPLVQRKLRKQTESSQRCFNAQLSNDIMEKLNFIQAQFSALGLEVHGPPEMEERKHDGPRGQQSVITPPRRSPLQPSPRRSPRRRSPLEPSSRRPPSNARSPAPPAQVARSPPRRPSPQIPRSPARAPIPPVVAPQDVVLQSQRLSPFSSPLSLGGSRPLSGSFPIPPSLLQPGGSPLNSPPSLRLQSNSMPSPASQGSISNTFRRSPIINRDFGDSLLQNL